MVTSVCDGISKRQNATANTSQNDARTFRLCDSFVSMSTETARTCEERTRQVSAVLVWTRPRVPFADS